MADNTRNPQHQTNQPSRPAPDQQQKQAETVRKPDAPADKAADKAGKTDHATGKAEKPTGL